MLLVLLFYILNIVSFTDEFKHDFVSINHDIVSLQEPIELLQTLKVNRTKDISFKENTFDPSKHLELNLLGSPTLFNDGTLAFQKLTILSPQGLQELRRIVDHYRYLYSKEYSGRQAEALRGLVYLSNFVKDLVESYELLSFLSQLAGVKLIPFGHTMNQGHTNFGKIGAMGADNWHFDSHSWVIVLLISDMKNSVGGTLRILNKGRISNETIFDGMPHESDGNFLRSCPKIVRAPLQFGEAILLRGSEVAHSVSPMISGAEDRISFTIGLQPASVFLPDANRLATWKHFDGNLAILEFYRMKARKFEAALNAIEEQSEIRDLGKRLKTVAQEMNRVADILMGSIDDRINFFDDFDEDKL